MENTCLPSGFHVTACARRFIHLRGHDAYLNTPMCVYFERKGAEGKYITTSHLVDLFRLWTSKIGYARLGFHGLSLYPLRRHHDYSPGGPVWQQYQYYRPMALRRLSYLSPRSSRHLHQGCQCGHETSREVHQHWPPHTKSTSFRNLIIFPFQVFPQWPLRLRVPSSSFMTILQTFNLMGFFSFVVLGSTEAQAIKKSVYHHTLYLLS